MSRLSNHSDGYAPLVSSDSGDEDNVKEQMSTKYQKTHRRHAFAVICVAVICLATGFAIGELLRQNPRPSIGPQKSCQNPIVRHEWRSLSMQEKSSYLQAVRCLRTVPSRLGLNTTLYDDFPYFHTRTGESGMFSTLHRCFIPN